MPPAEPRNPVAEGQRLMAICNACRYCEGYCAVFPALERRLTCTEADLNYFANLCHNCGECLYACQYAPPHEFAVNVPKVLAEIRTRSYKKYAWPGFFGVHPLWALVPGISLAGLLAGGRSASDAQFYAVVPHATMVVVFAALAALFVAVNIVGFLRFWRETGEGLPDFFQPAALLRGLHDALALTNLKSGSAGCTYPDERHSHARRWFHHLTFYGFLLCTASTSVAAVYHFSGYLAPYPYLSAPVVLGTIGGIGLLVGPAGLYLLKGRRDPALVDSHQTDSDVGFLALLLLTSLTGLVLLARRETGAMGTLLVVHLGVVAGLFLTLPYGKFVHGMYRTAALVRSALEGARGQH